MNIGIIGMGVVGTATSESLKYIHQIYGYDKYKKGSWKTPQQIVRECEVCFITVPTPMSKSGAVDLSAVEESIQTLYSYYHIYGKGPIIVIRSTAVSGTTRKFADTYTDAKFAFNPEFLTEKNSVEDMKNADRIIIGTSPDDYVFDKLARVYELAGFKCKIYNTTFEIAEMVKYMTNAFLATKVTFANEMYNVCKVTGINYNEVKELFKLDKRVGTSHLQVPGLDGKYGFSGKCLPKDINALIHLAQENGYSANLLKEVWRSNLQWRKDE